MKKPEPHPIGFAKLREYLAKRGLFKDEAVVRFAYSAGYLSALKHLGDTSEVYKNWERNWHDFHGPAVADVAEARKALEGGAKAEPPPVGRECLRVDQGVEARFRRVKAVQWNGPGDHPRVSLVSHGARVGGVVHASYKYLDDKGRYMSIFLGDWIVVDGDGQACVVSDTMFRRLYVEAEPEPEPETGPKAVKATQWNKMGDHPNVFEQGTCAVTGRKIFNIWFGGTYFGEVRPGQWILDFGDRRFHVLDDKTYQNLRPYLEKEA